jgi:hypothetical protein
VEAKLRLAPVVLAATLALSGSAVARDPVTGLIDSFFHYEPPPPPLGGNCAEIAARIGPAATWYGRFAGKRRQVNDRNVPFSADGCFESQAECRIWQQQAISYADGPIIATSCRRGLPAR